MVLLFLYIKVKMTDSKGSDIMVTNLRTEEVVPKSQYICSPVKCFSQVVNEAHVESMMRRAGKTRAQVKIWLDLLSI